MWKWTSHEERRAGAVDDVEEIRHCGSWREGFCGRYEGRHSSNNIFPGSKIHERMNVKDEKLTSAANEWGKKEAVVLGWAGLSQVQSRGIDRGTGA